MKCHNPTSRYYMILILSILALSNSIQDTKLVGMRNNCLFAPIVPTLPKSQLYYFFRYDVHITGFFVVPKALINSRSKLTAKLFELIVSRLFRSY